MKRKFYGIYGAGITIVVISLLAFVGTVGSVRIHSQGRLPSTLPVVLDLPYGIVLHAFDQTLGIFFFAFYFIGGQAVVPAFLAVCGFSLIRIHNWARKFLLAFSWFNLVVALLQVRYLLAPILHFKRLTMNSLSVLSAILLYGVFIIYFTRPTIKAEFEHRSR